MTEFNPAYATVKLAEIESFDGRARLDLSPSFIKLELSQSMGSIAYSGSITFLDTSGLLENAGFKIRGEEKLKLEIETHDRKMKDPLELHVQVISVTDVEVTDNQAGVQFTLNFISQLSYKVGTRRVRDSYYDLSASDTVKKVFEKYFGKLSKTENASNKIRESLPFKGKKYQLKETKGRNFYLQPTAGLLRVCIPSLVPSEAMSFMARRSFSEDSPSCSFRFFETFENFFFVTDEFLIQRGLTNAQRIEQFSYNASNSQDPMYPEMQTNVFKTFRQNSRVDTSADMRNGAYTNKVFEIDLTRRRAKQIDFNYTKDANYTDMAGKKSSINSSPHTKEFVEETFTKENAKRFIVFKDYYDESGSTLRANQYFPEIIQNTVVYGHHLFNTSLDVTIQGRLDLRPGDIIKVRIPNFSMVKNGEAPFNKQLSGNYMIYNCSNMLSENQLTTSLTIVKYDWSGDFIESLTEQKSGLTDTQGSF